MGLNGGGYTFLHPTSLETMTDDNLQKIFTDDSNFLMRTLRTDGRQTVSVLGQLANFRYVKMLFDSVIMCMIVGAMV